MEVRVNAAMSVDGKLSTRHREQLPISGPEDFDRVDDLRTTSDAILVGIGTVLADDPSLGRKTNDSDQVPASVVVDTRARTPTDARVFDSDGPTYILVGDSAPDERIADLKAVDATIVVAGDDHVDLPTALEKLSAEGIDRLLVEGGGEIVFSLFEADLVDALSVYVGSLIIGGRNAPTLADGEGFVDEAAFPTLELTEITRLDSGVVLEYDVP